MISKSSLAIQLSQLSGFITPKPDLEQYTTDSEIASQILWQAQMSGDIKEKIVADLGCGTGILGIGALLLGAKKCIFVDVDLEAIKIAKKNIQNIEEELEMTFDYEFINTDIRLFTTKVDTVLQNPPFGIQKAHADQTFLSQAFIISQTLYSIHKADSETFILSMSKHAGYKVTSITLFNFPIKHSMAHHTKPVEKIRVGCWRLVKQ